MLQTVAIGSGHSTVLFKVGLAREISHEYDNPGHVAVVSSLVLTSSRSL